MIFLFFHLCFCEEIYVSNFNKKKINWHIWQFQSSISNDNNKTLTNVRDVNVTTELRTGDWLKGWSEGEISRLSCRAHNHFLQFKCNSLDRERLNWSWSKIVIYRKVFWRMQFCHFVTFWGLWWKSEFFFGAQLFKHDENVEFPFPTKTWKMSTNLNMFLWHFTFKIQVI